MAQMMSYAFVFLLFIENRHYSPPLKDISFSRYCLVFINSSNFYNIVIVVLVYLTRKQYF